VFVAMVDMEALVAVTVLHLSSFFLHLVGFLVYLADLSLGLSSLPLQLFLQFSLQLVSLSAGFLIGTSPVICGMDATHVSSMITDVLVSHSNSFLVGETA